VRLSLVHLSQRLVQAKSSRVKTRLKTDGVTTSKVIDRLGREQEAAFINEANLYKTIFQSRKDSAERFTDWVTSEVLPSIRKTGS
jgi:anti-repressor protein